MNTKSIQRTLITAALTVPFCPALIIAQSTTWTNPSGGDFQTATNWSGGDVPDVNTSIRFDIPSAYTLTYSNNSTNPWADVEAGDVTFNLGGNTQTLTSTDVSFPSLIVDSGATATVVNGTIAAEEIQSSGEIILLETGEMTASSFSGGTLTLDGGNLTTGSFSGSLAHNDGELVVNGGTIPVAIVEAVDGPNADDHPILTLDGLSSQVNASTVFVGETNQGTLNLSGGTVVSSAGSIAAGIDFGSNGAIHLDGPLTRLETLNWAFVGLSGQGNLTVSNGAALNAFRMRVGTDGGSGLVEVEGTGSTIVSTDGTEVGGTGRFVVRDGASVNDKSFQIEGDGESVGEMIVEGSDSLLTATGSGSRIGSSGQGILTIRNGGGAIFRGSTSVGDSEGRGSLVIEGAGSSFTNEGSLSVGGSDSVGSVVVRDGGLLTTGMVGSSVEAFMGGNIGSFGSIDVVGQGSRWEDIGTGSIVLGTTVGLPNGIGLLRVSDGGVVDLGDSELEVKSLSRIELAGGTLTADRLRLLPGSRLSGYGEIDARVTSFSGVEITVTGGLLEISGSSVELGGDTLVTNSGTLSTSSFGPSTEVQGGAIIAASATLEAGKSISGYGIIVGQPSGPGLNLLASNPSGTVDFRGRLDVGTETATIYSQGRPTISGELVFLPGGQLVTPNNEYLVGNGGVIRGAADLSGQRFIGVEGSTVRAEGGLAAGPTNVLALGDASSAAGFYSNGSLIVEADANLRLDDANGAVLDSGALVTLGGAGQGSGPSTLVAASGLTLDFGGSIEGVGTIDTPDDAATPFINNGHIQGESLTEPITLEGYVKGVGTIDNAIITGTDAPGFSPASVLRGSISYSGVLEIELGGTNPGSDFDHLNHLIGDGIANLGGELQVLLLGGFSPELGDSFEILTATSVLSEFDSEILPSLGSGLEFDVEYTSSSVLLNVVAADSPGDFNGDLTVNGIDFLAWQRGESPNPFSGSDLIEWQENYGNTAENISAVSVPEPSTFCLLIIGLLSLRQLSRL